MRTVTPCARTDTRYSPHRSAAARSSKRTISPVRMASRHGPVPWPYCILVTAHGPVIAVRDRVRTPISLEGDSTREPLRDRPHGEDCQVLQEVFEVLGRQQQFLQLGGCGESLGDSVGLGHGVVGHGKPGPVPESEPRRRWTSQTARHVGWRTRRAFDISMMSRSRTLRSGRPSRPW